ncbi:DUF2254 domain-containing protein [Rhodococcus rhodochrous]|uniref:DUF2254 domain-containing protein n=1 Tax=Rhodococcus rhodochrous TaxID=1829 RepID=UPI0021F084CC|nr:DUF2254 domain-containing protein [Rhodococcus rhodochrous]
MIARPTFADLLDLVCTQPWIYGAGDPEILETLLSMLRLGRMESGHRRAVHRDRRSTRTDTPTHPRSRRRDPARSRASRHRGAGGPHASVNPAPTVLCTRGDGNPSRVGRAFCTAHEKGTSWLRRLPSPPVTRSPPRRSRPQRW